jgi:putative nucleotidyltransferase with HDIG domain
MLTREGALCLIKEHVRDEKLIKHMLAVEAIMKKVAEFLGEDQKKWGLVGLLHDLDYDEIEHPKYHGIIACDILAGKVNEEILKAIKSHNFENTKVMPESKLENCLIASDSISGLIIALALMMPSKKLAEVKAESIKKKFKQKDFARNCSRERIAFCEKAGIEKENFFEISLKALQEIAVDLGL